MNKSTFGPFLAVFLFYSLLNSCATETPNSAEELLEKYKVHQKNEMNPVAFNKLLAIAECRDPEGNIYETEVHSAEDGYCYFGQKFSDKDPYRALIFNDSVGHLLGGKDSINGDLDKESIFAIQSHEFHKIVLRPEYYFTDWELSRDTIFNGQQCWTVEATDTLGSPAILYFEQNSYLLSGWSIYNPFDPSEQITVQHLFWKNTSQGLMPDPIAIYQGPDKRYQFDFKRLKFNSSCFKRIEL